MISPDRKARLKWQGRRGMLELDLILSRFLEDNLDNLTSGQVDNLEALLSSSDPDLYSWLMGSDTPSLSELKEIVDFIKLHSHAR